MAAALAWNYAEPGFSLLLRTGISPAASGQPLLDLVQPVRTPEGLPVDDDVGRAECADRNGAVHLGLGAIFRRLVADTGAELVRVQTGLRADRDDVVGAGDVRVVVEVGAVERSRQLLCPLRVLRVQPVECAARRDRGNGEDRGMPVGDAEILRRAKHVAQVIGALDRYRGQRGAAGGLEGDAQQERTPLHLAAVFRRERVDLVAREIAVGRGEVEIEVDRVRHHAISIAMAVASPPPMHRLATPRLPPVFFSAPMRVTRIRAPEAPIGCPSAHAPPWMLTLSCGRPCSFIAAMVTTANASLISYRSTFDALQPVAAYSFLIAPTGAVVNQPGSCEWVV